MQNSTLPIIKHIPNFLDYLEIEKGLSNKTQENYSRFLNRFAEWLKKQNLRNLLPHELTADHVWKYRVFLSRNTTSEKSNQPLKKSTQNYYLIALRALLNYFADKDITSLPSEKIKLAKQSKEKTVHFLKLKQIERLILAPNIKEQGGLRDRAILETLFSTGLRVSELVQLNLEQFPIKDNQKYLELTIKGKGNKPRVIFFSERCLFWINKYMQSRRHIMDKALFVNFIKGAEKKPTRRLTTRSIENIVKKYVKIAGLDIATSPHTLRHSYATDLLSQGVDLRMIQEFLGHRNIITTQIYTHVTNKDLRDTYLKYHGGKNIKD